MTALCVSALCLLVGERSESESGGKSEGRYFNELFPGLCGGSFARTAALLPIIRHSRYRKHCSIVVNLTAHHLAEITALLLADNMLRSSKHRALSRLLPFRLSFHPLRA